MHGGPNDREGQALALRKRGRYFQRSRETDPRATEGTRNLSHTVGRGPVPRQASVEENALHKQRSRGTGPRATGARASFTIIARDRPSRYGNAGVIYNDREGQALALRDRGRYLQRSRGTGPRATARDTVKVLQFFLTSILKIRYTIFIFYTKRRKT